MLIPMTTPLALIFLVMLVLWLATFLRSAVGFGDALLAMPLIALLVFGASRADLRHQVELHLFGWLQARHEARQDPAELVALQLSEPDAIQRATAVDPRQLTRQQSAIAHWISRRYRVKVSDLCRINGIRESSLLSIGQRLRYN